MWFIKEYPWPIRGSPFPPLSTVPIHSKQIVGVRNEPDDFPHFKHHGWQDIWVKRRAHPTSSWHWLLVIFPYMKAIPTLAVQLSCGILCLNLGQLTHWGQHHQIIEPCYDIPSWFTWGWPTHVKSTNVYTCRWVIFLLVMHAWILWGTHWICHQQALFHVKTNITSSGYAWKIRGSSWTSKKTCETTGHGGPPYGYSHMPEICSEPTEPQPFVEVSLLDFLTWGNSSDPRGVMMLRQVLPRFTGTQEEQTIARKETISSHSPKRRMWIASLGGQKLVRNKTNHGSHITMYRNIGKVSEFIPIKRK